MRISDWSSDVCSSDLIILLGELIDRGPNAAGIVQRAADLAEATGAVRFLKGNHEEVFLQAAKGDVQATRFLFRFGGRETVFSYGLSEAELDQLDFEELTDWLLNHVPRAHVDFLDGFEDMVEIGDYAFVHAGIKPGVPLAEQKPEDLRWIRDELD